MLKFFVADPYAGSGAFLTLDPGWKISDPGKNVSIFNPKTVSKLSGSGMFIPDPDSFSIPDAGS
jgi:hypothetical protein